ncbi:MAG TPA: hypothetical protein VF855_08690 [Acidimicrobiales bacterium]
MPKDNGLPKTPKHDFTYGAVQGWRRREESPERYELTVLAALAGQVVRVERRDGTFVVGTARQHPTEDWWWPDRDGGSIIIDPGGIEVRLDDIVSLAAEPDPDYTHDSDWPGHEV